MTATLYHSYRRPLPVRAAKGLLACALLILSIPNLILGSRFGIVRATSRLALLGGAITGTWLFWGQMQRYLLQAPLRRMSDGKVLDHVHSAGAVFAAIGVWIVLIAAVGAALTGIVFASDALAKLDDTRWDGIEATMVTLWTVLIISALLPMIYVCFNSEDMTEAQVASLYFTHPKAIHLPNDSRVALQLAADHHLQVNSCMPHTVSRDYDDKDVTICRSKTGITVQTPKMAKAAKQSTAKAAKPDAPAQAAK